MIHSDTLNIVLTNNWDATLTYDLLESPIEDRSHPKAIVGRENMMASIVNAIQQRDPRGTFLISGYRSTGKTTLVVNAARHARNSLENQGKHLLPLVLNVSEVAASLMMKNDEEERNLQIDARKMLTALLGTLNNKRMRLKLMPMETKRKY